jgi:hypothetical protein
MKKAEEMAITVISVLKKSFISKPSTLYSIQALEKVNTSDTSGSEGLAPSPSPLWRNESLSRPMKDPPGFFSDLISVHFVYIF